MQWKADLDALVEETMAFSKSVMIAKPVNAPMSAVQQVLAESPTPIQRYSPATERDEILKRVQNFKVHQERVKREREEFYADVTAKMRAIIDGR